jgi:hypothetical protein
MGKFNSNVSGTSKTPDSTNAAGGASFSRADFRQDIAAVVLTSMLTGDKFYETEVDRLKRIESLCTQGDNASFVAKAMLYARNVCNLRSISHYLAVLTAENAKHSGFVRSSIRNVIQRPDDALEIVALFNSRNKGHMLPNGVRRAFKDVLESKFDEYQFRKYQGLNSSVKLRDIVKMVRPNPEMLIKAGKTDDRDIFKRVIEGNLKAIQTAQTVNAGSTGEERASNYKDLLLSKKLGYMAALKNIRNIVESKADKETIDLLCTLLVNEKAILNSKLLPFRFYQAYREVQAISMDAITRNQLLEAIETGFVISARNVPIVQGDERVAILLDESGSMSSGNLSGMSYFEIGKVLVASMFGGLKKGNVTTWLWSDTAREVSIKSSPMDWVLKQETTGGGTDVYGAVSGLLKTKTCVDVMAIISDMQVYAVDVWSRGKTFANALADYKSQINPNVKVLFWNVAGYAGGTPCKLTNGVLEVSGFSSSILDVAANMLKYSDVNYLVNEIEKIEL